MSRYEYVYGGVLFDDVPAPSAAALGEAEFLEDFLNAEGGGGEMVEEYMMGDPSGGGMEDLEGFPTYPFLELGNSSMRFSASTPATPGQPPPPVASISNPCSPPNSSTGPEEEKLPQPHAYVEILEPSALELQDMTRREWIAEVASMLPHDILRKAPRKRGEGKYFSSGQKYKPCNWEKYIERVNEKINAGKYKVVAKRPRRQRQLRDPEETSNPVIVARQAQAEIYGEHFNGAATYVEWD